LLDSSDFFLHLLLRLREVVADVGEALPFSVLLLRRRPRDHGERHPGGIEQKHQVIQTGRDVSVHEARQALAAPPRSFEQIGSLVSTRFQPGEHKPDRRVLDLSGAAACALGRVLRQWSPESSSRVLAELAGVRGVHAWGAATRGHWNILAQSVTPHVTNGQCVS